MGVTGSQIESRGLFTQKNQGVNKSFTLCEYVRTMVFSACGCLGGPFQLSSGLRHSGSPLFSSIPTCVQPSFYAAARYSEIDLEIDLRQPHSSLGRAASGLAVSERSSATSVGNRIGYCGLGPALVRSSCCFS